MIVTISFNAAPGKRDALVAKMHEILPDTRAFDGCNSVIIAESNDTPGEIVLVEDWDDEASYEAYKQWRRDSGTTVLGSDLVEAGSVTPKTFTALA